MHQWRNPRRQTTHMSDKTCTMNWSGTIGGGVVRPGSICRILQYTARYLMRYEFVLLGTQNHCTYCKSLGAISDGQVRPGWG